MAQLGIQDLSADEEALIAQAKGVKDGKSYDHTLSEMVKVVNKRAHIGWTTGGHTGEDVVLYVYAANHANQLSGTIQNIDIATYSAKALGLDLAAASSKLFVPMTQITQRGYKVSYNGINVYNGKSFYVPEAALSLMK